MDLPCKLCCAARSTSRSLLDLHTGITCFTTHDLVNGVCGFGNDGLGGCLVHGIERCMLKRCRESWAMHTGTGLGASDVSQQCQKRKDGLLPCIHDMLLSSCS